MAKTTKATKLDETECEWLADQAHYRGLSESSMLRYLVRQGMAVMAECPPDYRGHQTDREVAATE